MSIFIATYATVALLAFQQLNVAGRHYYTAFITAFMIALAQYFFIRLAADSKSLYDVLIIGFGGGLGALTAMKIHDGLKGWKDGNLRGKVINEHDKNPSPIYAVKIHLSDSGNQMEIMGDKNA